MEHDIDSLAQIVWDYHHMNQPLERSDVILVQGSHDPRVAERGAELFLAGWAPLIVFSGGLGNLAQGLWEEPEGDCFSRIARRMGVPGSAIRIENRSSNTGENVHFTRRLLEAEGLDPERFLLVQKPYMERRTYATFNQVWPEKHATVTSPQLSFIDYPTAEISKEQVIHIMVGDLQRIRLYPLRGFQTPQDIPAEVQEAYERLVDLGYTDNLIR